jgi:hypothetical protein
MFNQSFFGPTPKPSRPLYILCMNKLKYNFNRFTNLFCGPRKHFLIACFQKSGSTYLVNIVNIITGFRLVKLVDKYGNNEQDLYQNQLRSKNPIDYICQQHVKGTENNIRLIKKYGIYPVVHVRNIQDVVFSLRDHFEREDHKTPTGYVHREYFDMSDEDKLMYLIRIHLPWYLNFYISWLEASKTVSCLWTSYEELFIDQVGTISKILSFFSFPYTEIQIVNAIQIVKERNTRLNIGKTGRGFNLPEPHKEEIEKLANVWKIDRSLWKNIGLNL